MLPRGAAHGCPEVHLAVSEQQEATLPESRVAPGCPARKASNVVPVPQASLGPQLILAACLAALVNVLYAKWHI